MRVLSRFGTNNLKQEESGTAKEFLLTAKKFEERAVEIDLEEAEEGRKKERKPRAALQRRAQH